MRRLFQEVTRNKPFLTILTLTLMIFSTLVISSRAAFTSTPTLDLSASSHITDARSLYTFYIENTDPSESLSAYSATIPAGYTIDEAFLTTTPGLLLPGFTGSFGFITGHITVGSLIVKTTTTIGLFNVNGSTLIGELRLGNVTIIPPTLTTAGLVKGLLNTTFPNTGIFVELKIDVINPPTVGIYIWAPNQATPVGGGDNVTMNPRSGFTNQVNITRSVGGQLLPTNRTIALAPYFALAGLITTVSVAYIIAKRRRTLARMAP
jgi:hypothetical protein